MARAEVSEKTAMYATYIADYSYFTYLQTINYFFVEIF